MHDVHVRDRILGQATRLFGRKGFAATSVREVVEAAGVAKPTLYYYFANKQDLFAECVRVQLDGLGAMIDAEIAAEGTVQERLHHFLTLYVGQALHNPDVVRLLMVATNFTVPNQPQLDTMRAFSTVLSRLERLFEQGIERGELRPDIDVALARKMLTGTADNVLVVGLMGGRVPPDYADRIIGQLFEGIGT